MLAIGLAGAFRRLKLAAMTSDRVERDSFGHGSRARFQIQAGGQNANLFGMRKHSRYALLEWSASMRATTSMRTETSCERRREGGRRARRVTADRGAPGQAEGRPLRAAVGSRPPAGRLLGELREWRRLVDRRRALPNAHHGCRERTSGRVWTDPRHLAGRVMPAASRSSATTLTGVAHDRADRNFGATRVRTPRALAHSETLVPQ